ncbi:hypothetical protein LTR15_005169 [Elasticomyces elasticus]|nr:hypothetical protein LTR15_005169 [Elasticomyces elasticus]
MAMEVMVAAHTPSMSHAPASPYSRPLLSPDEHIIRVLRLTTEREQSEIEVTGALMEISLYNPLPYVALSYRWGDDPPHIPIAFENGSVNVTSNAHAALVELAKSGIYPYVWIDALSGKAVVWSEKELQVAMMHEVYSAAETVIVWLGKASDGSDEALEWCEYISWREGGHVVAKMPYRPNLLNKRERKQAIQMCREFLSSFVVRWNVRKSTTCYDTVPESVRKLLGRDWFTRMWTVQEAALAQAPIVMCGNKSIYWSHLVAGIQRAAVLSPSPDTIAARNAVDCIQFFWLCLVQLSWDRLDARLYSWYRWTRQSVETMAWVRWCWVYATGAAALNVVVRRLLSGHWRVENTDPDAWVFIALIPGCLIIFLCCSPPMELIEGRGGLLHDSLVANINRVRSRDAGDQRDKVFALHGTLKILGIALDAPEYDDRVTVSHVYHRFTTRFIEWHQTLEILIEACYPPPLDAPTWVPDLARPYKRWNTQPFAAAGDSTPDYWFYDATTLCTTGRSLGSISDSREDLSGPNGHRYFAVASYTGSSPAPVETGDLLVLISGLKVPILLRSVLFGYAVIGMAEIQGIMSGEAWNMSQKVETFTLV